MTTEVYTLLDTPTIIKRDARLLAGYIKKAGATDAQLHSTHLTNPVEESDDRKGALCLERRLSVFVVAGSIDDAQDTLGRILTEIKHELCYDCKVGRQYLLDDGHYTPLPSLQVA